MSPPSRYASAFARRLLALTREAPAASEGDAESVHRFRVASRRLRAALPALPPDAPARAGNPGSIRKQARTLTRAFGGVRELDVSLGLLDEYGAAHPDLRRALRSMRGPIARERSARRRQMLRTLRQIDPAALAARIRTLVAESDTAEGHARRRARLADRVEARTAELAAQMDAVGQLYAPFRLHPVRIAAKKLRYALELARELHGVPTLALTRRLKAVQDQLGRLHDLEVLTAWTRVVRSRPAATRARRAAVSAVIDAEIARLHAGYLGQQPLLAFVLARCRTHTLPALREPQSAGPLEPESASGREAS